MESLRTVVTEVEKIMNDRPLTHTSSDINDSEALTPSHLLYGRRISSLPYPNFDIDESSMPTFMDNSTLTKRSERQSEILQHFWRRWRSEYLTSLREFHRTSGNNMQLIKLGDVVLVHDESPRLTWKLAVVTELIRGNDGHVRAARIRMKNTETTRSLVKLYPLEVTCNGESDETTGTRPRRLASVKAQENIRNLLKTT